MRLITRTVGEGLVSFARRCLESHFGSKASAVLAPGPLPDRVGGVFVTVRRDGALRGCVGFVGTRMTLAESVRRATIAAVSEDPRFAPVDPTEIDRLTLTVSVLSPPTRVSDLEDISIGRDGLIVEAEQRRGLLLPAVAVERGWDRATFLAETCRKAGLPTDCWAASTTSIWRFQAESFEEN